MGHICFSVEKNYYATIWSNGMICVGCGCCGKQGKGLKMWKLRLKFHESELKRELEFDNWDEKFIKEQKKNVKSNIVYENRMIKKCKERIKYFTKKT